MKRFQFFPPFSLLFPGSGSIAKYSHIITP
jgi:hypothetical protein